MRPKPFRRVNSKALLAVALAGGVLSGCGAEERASTASAAAPEPPSAESTASPAVTSEPVRARASAARRGRTIKAVDSQFGRILADGRGQAVYIFDKETSSRPECYGACAKAWPPVLTKGRPRAGKNTSFERIASVRRRDGSRQVTLNGRPLYYYVSDAPGRVLCHDVREFGGLWLVLKPDGSRVPS
jgi:predicted lipoprotein with Yx(FWY)xxD motif